MSERSKGDTSSSLSHNQPTTSSLFTSVAAPPQQRVVKNSLLSAAVTGVTFDDFSNHPLLLPAAPPIIAEPPIISQNTIIRESKPTVTVGKTPDIDTDTLSEINLNSSVDEDGSSDINDNPLDVNQQPQDDSILSQAASSFSQLPSVASSVFSTFSKKIKDYSPARELAVDNDLNGNSATQQLAEHNFQQPQFGVTSAQSQNLFDQGPLLAPASAATVPEPPTFYAPTELPTVPNPSAIQPPSIGSSNNYRLSAKRKLYAPIPGLSAHFEPTPNPPHSLGVNNHNLPPLPPQQQPIQQDYSHLHTAPVEYSQPLNAIPQPEERKGLFSLSNLAPTSVLQNITGFVQQATDTITGKSDSDSTFQQNSTNLYQQHSSENCYAVGYQADFATVQPDPSINITSGYNQPVVSTEYPIPAPPEQASLVKPPTGALPTSTFQPDPAININSGYNPLVVSTEHPIPAPPGPTSLVKPPTGTLPTSTFRLQKGTKLYKSPFAAGAVTNFSQTSPPELFGVQSQNFFAPTDPQPASNQFQPPSVVSQYPVFNNQTFTNTPPQVFNPFPIQPEQQPAAYNQPPTSQYFNPAPTTNLPLEVNKNLQSSAELLTENISSSQNPIGFEQQPVQFFNPLHVPSQEPAFVVPTGIEKQSLTNITPIQFFQTENTQGEDTIKSIISESPVQFFNPKPLPTTESEFLVPTGIEEQTSSQNTHIPSVKFFQTENTPISSEPPVGFFKPISVPTREPEVVVPTGIKEVSSQNTHITPVQFFQDENTHVEDSIKPVSCEPPVQFFNTISVPKQDSVPPVNEKPQQPLTESISSTNFTPIQFFANDNPQVEDTISSEPPVQFFNPLHVPTQEPAFVVPPVIEDKQQQLTENIPTSQNPTITPVQFSPSQNPINKEIDFEPPVLFFNPLLVPTPESVPPIIEEQPQPETTTIENNSEPISEEKSSIQLFNPVQVLNAQPDLVPISAERKISNSTTEQILPPSITPSSQLFPEATIQPLGFDLIQSKPSQIDQTANFLPPPPQTGNTANDHISLSNNPYRRGSHSSHLPHLPPTLSSIFTPADPSQPQQQSSVFDFFANPVTIASAVEEPKEKDAAAPSNIFNPIAPASILPVVAAVPQPPSFVSSTDPVSTLPLSTSVQQQPSTNLTNFFDNSIQSVAPKSETIPTKLLDPSSFFDSFYQPAINISETSPTDTAYTSAAVADDSNSQLIQNFFNNPPPQDIYDSRGDLNYNLVGSGLAVKNIEARSVTPISNLVEPPSSSCSDFSELNSSTASALIGDNSNKAGPNENLLSEDITNDLETNTMLKGTASATAKFVYSETKKHWFYKRADDKKQTWTPFSYIDSGLLEDSFLAGENRQNIVAVEGGRFDVNIRERLRTPIYWEGEPTEVRRCSWFYKSENSKSFPYDEAVAELLEDGFKEASINSEWHKSVEIGNEETVIFHAPTDIVNVYQSAALSDSWGRSSGQSISRTRVVKRDLDDFTIDQGEPHKVDHLLFMVHGIGSACDFKFRSVEEVVDDFRSIALHLVQSHYKNSADTGHLGRVEVLPISWHEKLHSAELGIDEKLKAITLESIPKLRNFTNDTLLDILFYTSPVFCQKIINAVAASMNSVYMKYCNRNPDFNGGISLAGHSLGSLILFDLLGHQKPTDESEVNKETHDKVLTPTQLDTSHANETYANTTSYTMGTAGTGQPFITYPQLIFQPKKFFALGSPIGMFVTIRGIDALGLDFKLPTCPGFYNIFHPYDPVAYRIEALVNPDMSGIRPVLIPHHKGRKRMHLELKETVSRVGADIMQRLAVTFKNLTAKKSATDEKEMQREVDKVLEMQMQLEQQRGSPTTTRPRADSTSTTSDTDMIEIDFPLGKLNDSKRIDYVLQEAPLEFFNEYIFALSSHVCYWDSADTILFVMKEIYTSLGFSPDSQLPPQTMTIERPSSGCSSSPTN